MKRFRLIVVFVCIAILLFATWCWFLPVGEGEYADSPDGQYTASAGNCTRGTWLRGRISFIEIQIIEKSSGSVVWKSERYLRPNEVPPEFYNRRKSISSGQQTRDLSRFR